MRARAIRHLITALSATAAIASGCGTPTEAVLPQTIVGTLGGDRTTGCTYLDGAYARWPAGVVPRFDPVRLEDVTGAVVARDGDRLTVTGGPSGEPPPRQCAGDRTVIVISIDAVDRP